MRNPPDADLRELERRAATGDHEAMDAAVRLRTRLGVDTLGWLAEAGPYAVEHLDPELVKKLTRVLLIAQTVPLRPDAPKVPDARQNGWFPDHTQQTICPRGHHVATHFFLLNEIANTGTYFRIYDYDDAYGLIVGSDGEIEELPNVGLRVLSCSGCGAHWPSDGSFIMT